MTKTSTSISMLAAAGLVSRTAALEAAAARYAVAVTPAMAALIGDADDPIGRQFLPRVEELVTTPDERADPIGDHAFSPVPGIVHRYPDRVLLKALHVCPVYCRFCFRREMVGPEGDGLLAGEALEAALQYIAARPAIWEVIVTGGDPFMLSARRVKTLVQRISAMPHVQVLRWHTRVPVVDPARVTNALAGALRDERLTGIVAVHANHAREFTPQALTALRRLSASGQMLLSQSVLLRGVNDDAATLEALMRAFIAHGVKPYYLHHPDLAPGTSHFRLPIARGQELMRELRTRLSGIALPTYVLDVPDGAGKVPVGPSHAEDGAVVTLTGERVAYPV